jgi:hypothetical protein
MVGCRVSDAARVFRGVRLGWQTFGIVWCLQVSVVAIMIAMEGGMFGERNECMVWEGG